MQDELFCEVQRGLAARKGEWRKISEAIPGVSYSWISRVGRGKYESRPIYDRLRAVAEYLRQEKE